MNHSKYIPTHSFGSWGNYSVDKVAVNIFHGSINEGIKQYYRDGAITILDNGPYATICFHAECLGPDVSVLQQIAFHIYELATRSVFIPEVTACIINTLNMKEYYHVDLNTVLSLFSNLISISQLELAFDFDVSNGYPWIIQDHSKFIHYGTTLYSKDYKQKTKSSKSSNTVKNGVQRSLVSIYDHSTCHNTDGNIYRFELRFCGVHAKRWNFEKLGAVCEDFLSKQNNMIAGTLHKAMKPGSIQFDMDRIEQSHPILFPILGRWQSWGKRKE